MQADKFFSVINGERRNEIIRAALNGVAKRREMDLEAALSTDDAMIARVMELWVGKMDTKQMAVELREHEANVARWLRIGRERRILEAQ